MPERLRTTVESFNTGGPAMAAFYIVADPEHGELRVESTPVIGWIVKRNHYDDGDTEDMIEAGVLNTEFNVVETPESVYDNTSNTALIGVFPAGTDPSKVDINIAKWTLREDLRSRWETAKQSPEPHRTRNMSMFEKLGKALGEVAE